MKKISKGDMKLLDELIEKQYVRGIVRLEFGTISEEEDKKTTKKIKKITLKIAKQIDDISSKEKLTLSQSLCIVDSLYRTATWSMYQKFGNDEELHYSILNCAKGRKERIEGYL